MAISSYTSSLLLTLALVHGATALPQHQNLVIRGVPVFQSEAVYPIVPKRFDELDKRVILLVVLV